MRSEAKEGVFFNAPLSIALCGALAAFFLAGDSSRNAWVVLFGTAAGGALAYLATRAVFPQSGRPRTAASGPARREWSHLAARLLDAFQASWVRACRRGGDFIGIDDLFCGLLDLPQSAASAILAGLGLRPQDLRPELEDPTARKAEKRRLLFTPAVRLVLQVSTWEARSLGHDAVGTGHLLLAFLRCRPISLAPLLERIDYDAARRAAQETPPDPRP